MGRALSCAVKAGLACAVMAGATILSVVGILAAGVVYEHYYPSPKFPGWEQVTTPLPAEVVRDLCRGLELPADCEPCRPGAVVYAPDFFPGISERFKPGVATREEVDRVLGRYRLECLGPRHQYDDLTLIYCSYNLLGSGSYFEFRLEYREDGILYRMVSGSSEN